VTGCETLAGAALVYCLAQQPGCLPSNLSTDRLRWLAATVEIESGPRGPWAIRNETAKQSRWFPTREAAEREALRLHALGHILGLGPAQITGAQNLKAYGLADAQGRPVRAFNLCLNLRSALQHMRADEGRAVRLAMGRQFNGGPRAALPGVVAGTDAYAMKVETRFQSLPEFASVPPSAPSTECPSAPPSWDVWGSARHAARCERLAVRRTATTSTGTLNQ
jgi:hypothetical protein